MTEIIENLKILKIPFVINSLEIFFKLEPKSLHEFYFYEKVCICYVTLDFSVLTTYENKEQLMGCVKVN